MAKRKEIDIKEVERLSGLGLTEEQISLSLGISVDTFGRRKSSVAEFAEAIKRGKTKAADVVSSKLMDLIKRGNLGAIIWYEKTRLGYSDRTDIRIDWRDKAKRDGHTDDEIQQAFDDMVAAARARIVAGRSGGGSLANGEG